MQRELAREIAHEIKITVSPSEEKQLANSATVNPQAHDLYLKGRFFWNHRTRDGLSKAEEYFRQASEIDPNDSLAMPGLPILTLSSLVSEISIPLKASPKPRRPR